jgi:DNA-binding NarL/FixJ family response regulator
MAIVRQFGPIPGDGKARNAAADADVRPLAAVHILVAEDSEWFRQFVSLALQARPDWQIICEVSDGLKAVQKAEEFKPDLILLDIGLPKLNGIEAARRIRQVAPGTTILFLTLNRDAEVVRAALNTGEGYVLKTDAGSELQPAIEAVLEGEQYVSSGLVGRSDSSRACETVLT